MKSTELLDQFAAALSPAESKTLDLVRAYVGWRVERQGADFARRGADDVELRTYLADLRASGASRADLKRRMSALKRFYAWAKAANLIPVDPFAEFNFDRPILSRDQIRRRQERFAGGAREREIGHLRGLNRLAEDLNRSLDVQSALDVTLDTLVEVMALKTAWAFVLNDSSLVRPAASGPSLNDFAVPAACNLPPGLEQNDGYFLTQPPDCHCQALLREGRLTRAVNVVECTRLLDSAEAQGDTQGLLFHASVPLTVDGRPVGILNFATEEWQFMSAADLQLLSAAGVQISSALERARLYDLVRAGQDRLERELAMARQVQASLLPDPLPEIPGFGLAAEWRAASEIAGDFYDVFPLPVPAGQSASTRRWVIVIGDVSDKGAPAALYMAMTRGLLRSGAESAPGPAALLCDLNRALCAQSTSSMFVSLFCAVFDPATGRLSYANAGHNPPVLRSGEGLIAALAPTGPLIGVYEELAASDRDVVLSPGDTLVAYTDGLTEALNAQGEEYGPTRLARAVAAGPSQAGDLLHHLLADLAAFTDEGEQADDITLVALTRHPKSTSTSDV